MEAAKKSNNKPHVLVLPYPAQGHINPMRQFCKRLVCRRIKVTLATTVYISKSMRPDPNSQITTATISDGYDDDGGRLAKAASSGAYLATFRTVGSQTLAHLIDKLNNSGQPINAVVYDPFLPWALDVAKQFGVVDWMSKLWRVRTIGPTIPSMYLDKQLMDDKDYGVNIFNSNSTTCMNWLNGKPNGSVIYVSFGSRAELEAEQMEEIAWSLKNISFNFLWVVRALEEPKLSRNFVDATIGKGLIVNWSPQLEVLAHESTVCFVTHCGFNSILESIGLGVPMVGVPQWTDQSTNAKYVEDVWCIGVSAKVDEKGIVRRQVLESCIKEVMEGERGREIKKNAIKWRNLAKEAIDVGGSSDKNIDEFVAELMRSY